METTDEHRWTQILQGTNKHPRLLRRSPFGETLGGGPDGLPDLCSSVVSLLFNYIVPAKMLFKWQPQNVGFCIHSLRPSGGRRTAETDCPSASGAAGNLPGA